MNLDVVIEKGPQPTKARCAATIAEHRRAQFWVSRMNGDMKRRDSLSNNPLEVHLGEPSQGREVPVEERQPVVVVLQVQRLS